MILENFGFFTKFYFIFLHEILKLSPEIENKDKRKLTISTCVRDIDANACASKSTKPQLLLAQGLKSISLTVVSKSFTKSTTISEICAKINALTPFHLSLTSEVHVPGCARGRAAK